MDQEFLTVEEASARLKVHEETIRRWLKAGRLRGTLISRRAGWRIPAEDVHRVLTGESPMPAPTSAPARDEDGDR